MSGELTPHQSEDLQKCVVAGVYWHLHKFVLQVTGICTDYFFVFNEHIKQIYIFCYFKYQRMVNVSCLFQQSDVMSNDK